MNTNLEADLKRVYSLLKETEEWLCSHAEIEDKKPKVFFRLWCDTCNNYIRSKEELSLKQRVREALEQISL